MLTHCHRLHCMNASIAAPPIIRKNKYNKHRHTLLTSTNYYQLNDILRLHVKLNHSVHLSSVYRRGDIRAAGLAQSNSPEKGQEEVALLWFKQDLRIDDHPGLVRASQFKTLIPVYVFDHDICSRLSSQMLEMLIDAVQNLKQLLRDQNSDLIIRYGRAEDILLALVKEVNVTHIITEEELEYDWLNLVHSFSKSLATVYVSGEIPRFIFWQAHIFEFENWEEIPDSYREFQKMKKPSVPPLSCPTLPVLLLDIDRGKLPELNTLRGIVEGKTNLQNFKTNRAFNEQHLQNKESSFFSQEAVNQMAIGAGATTVRNALDGYLRYLEATWRDDWQEYVLIPF